MHLVNGKKFLLLLGTGGKTGEKTELCASSSKVQSCESHPGLCVKGEKEKDHDALGEGQGRAADQAASRAVGFAQ